MPMSPRGTVDLHKIPKLCLELGRSRELTRVCSSKVTHHLVADIVGVDVLWGDRMTNRSDLARAN
jgi:hypothetical protein